MLLLGCAVFVSDALSAYLSGQFWKAFHARALKSALFWGGCLDLVIGVNIIGFKHADWMVIPSVLGGLAGIYWTLRPHE